MAQKMERPLGARIADFSPTPVPSHGVLHGRYVRLEPLSTPHHGPDLAHSLHDPFGAGPLWDYLFSGPFASDADFLAWLEEMERQPSIWFYAFVPDKSGKASGMGSFMRLDSASGVIEIGNIWMSSALQRTREATEAIYLLIRHAFEVLQVRRLEWKCNALNEPSRRAALRFGFTFEGIFRQHMVVKGRNRDTAWYSMLDTEWAHLAAGYARWLAPENFDAKGRQKTPLTFASDKPVA